MKILLTGVTGFIGSHLASQWENNSHEVIGVARRKPRFELNMPIVYADLSEGVPLKESVDVIIHAAAQPSSSDTPVDAFIRNNIEATRNLIRYAQDFDVRKFIYLSSISIYGNISVNVVDEKTPLVNPDIYGLTKYIGELLLQDECRWLSSVSLRLPGVIGKGSAKCWLAQVAKKLKNGQKIWIHHPESRFNNIVHLTDLERFISRLIVTEQDGCEVVTLGCRDPLTINETVSSFKKYLNSSSEIRVKPSDQASFVISLDRACQLQYDPQPAKQILEAYSKEC